MSSATPVDASGAAPNADLESLTSMQRFGREVEWIIRLLVGGIFVWSGTAHLANPYYFLSTVYQYELTSAPVGMLIASYLPFLELLLAVCLLSGICRRPTWILTTLLLIAFASVQGSALSRGLLISCGCFGPEINRPVDATSLSFTSGLAVLSLVAMILSWKRVD